MACLHYIDNLDKTRYNYILLSYHCSANLSVVSGLELVHTDVCVRLGTTFPTSQRRTSISTDLSSRLQPLTLETAITWTQIPFNVASASLVVRRAWMIRRAL